MVEVNQHVVIATGDAVAVLDDEVFAMVVDGKTGHSYPEGRICSVEASFN